MRLEAIGLIHNLTESLLLESFHHFIQDISLAFEFRIVSALFQ
jgi:hypothetical protein